MTNFVFVVHCHHCNELIKVADDPTDGKEQFVADNKSESLTCPKCGKDDQYRPLNYVAFRQTLH